MCTPYYKNFHSGLWEWPPCMLSNSVVCAVYKEGRVTCCPMAQSLRPARRWYVGRWSSTWGWSTRSTPGTRRASICLCHWGWRRTACSCSCRRPRRRTRGRCSPESTSWRSSTWGPPSSAGLPETHNNNSTCSSFEPCSGDEDYTWDLLQGKAACWSVYHHSHGG